MENGSARAPLVEAGGAPRQPRRWSLLRSVYGPAGAASTVRTLQAGAEGTSLQPVAPTTPNTVRSRMDAETTRIGGQFQKFSSLDYGDVDNDVFREHVRKMAPGEQTKKDFSVFFVAIMIGAVTGFFTWLMLFSIEQLQELKNGWIMPHLGGTSPWMGWGLLIPAHVVLFGLSSFLVVIWQPPATGSGIPEVKSYLNGVWINGAFEAKTGVAKFFSAVLACTTGIPVGPEGPIIHMGGVIGAVLSKRAMFEAAGVYFTNVLLVQREAITQGVAAGVAAAFGSPIGGLLFTGEEVASFWSSAVMYKGFLASMASYVVSTSLREIVQGKGKTLFVINDLENWGWEELPFFFLIGILAGFAGALFNTLNVCTNQLYRKKYLNKPEWKARKLCEAMMVPVIVSILWVFLPGLVACKRFDAGGVPEPEWKEDASTLWCSDPEHEYNPLGTIMFAGLDDQVKQLYTSGKDTGITNPVFGPLILFAYGAIYFVCTGTIAGCHVATGILIPMIIIGAALGRSYGAFLHAIFPHWHIDLATYAVLGSASFLAGVTHMAVALTVIMLEITGNFNFLLPIMIAVNTAKAVAELFTPPLYDMIIEVKHIPFLEPSPTQQMHQLRCQHIMKRKIVSLVCVPKMRDVLDLLNDKKYTHNGFPIVSEDGVLIGQILRSHLQLLLKHRLYRNHGDEYLSDQHVCASLMHHGSAQEPWSMTAADFPGNDLDITYSLDKLMNSSPITIKQDAPASQAFNLFRQMGLRHLPVVDNHSVLRGMITRGDLADVQMHPGKYAHRATARHENLANLRAQAVAREQARANKGNGHANGNGNAAAQAPAVAQPRKVRSSVLAVGMGASGSAQRLTPSGKPGSSAPPPGSVQPLQAMETELNPEFATRKGSLLGGLMPSLDISKLIQEDVIEEGDEDDSDDEYTDDEEAQP